MSKTVINFEMYNDDMLVEHLQGNCADLIALLAIITATLESELPSELRGKFRTNLLKAINTARNEILD